jgi:hypothetical protein
MTSAKYIALNAATGAVLARDLSARKAAAFRLGYKGARWKLIELDNESRILGYDYMGREVVLRDGPLPHGSPLIEIGGSAKSRADRLWHRVNAANWVGVCGVSVEAQEDWDTSQAVMLEGTNKR